LIGWRSVSLRGSVLRKGENPVTFVGHPLARFCSSVLVARRGAKKFALDLQEKPFGLFPGSRRRNKESFSGHPKIGRVAEKAIS
jgi:lipid A disaccharide synthetase